MKKQYSFIILIIIMLYLLFQVVSYKYEEYRIYQYTQQLTQINEKYLSQISLAQDMLEHRNTRAYKNKILKSEERKKNPGEEVIFLISEERYNKYTQTNENPNQTIFTSQNLDDTQSLIASMSTYERWIYFLFKRDIR